MISGIETSEDLSRYLDGIIDRGQSREILREGAEIVIYLHDKHYATVVFIDKTARPAAIFFSAIWHRLYPDEKPPAFRFINGQNVHSGEDPDFISVKVDEIKRKFKQEDFAGKNVLLFDEIMASGFTAARTGELIKSAFAENPPIIRYAALKVTVWKWDHGIEKKDVDQLDGNSLGSVLVGNKVVEEVAGSAFVRPNKRIPHKLTSEYLLFKIGQHESLTDEQLSGKNNILARLRREGEGKELRHQFRPEW